MDADGLKLKIGRKIEYDLAQNALSRNSLLVKR